MGVLAGVVRHSSLHQNQGGSVLIYCRSSEESYQKSGKCLCRNEEMVLYRTGTTLT
jgi:hypothetical protein